MREIKFRVWLNKENRMIDPVTGIDFSHPYPTVQWFEDVHDALSNNVSDCFMEDCELLQYTGLKDKNGVDIFEGDLFKRENNWPIYKVVFEEGCFMLENHGMLYPMHSREIREEMSEILGNAYENADLLK